jgi:hypothetical protein
MPVLQRREIDISMQFECGGCGFSAPVSVRGRGFATGALSGEGLSAQAQQGALKNARMRCELTPCPRCGQRSFATFRRSIVRDYGLVAAFVALVIVVQYVADARTFEGAQLGVAVAIYASLTVLLLGGIGIAYELEIRSAPRKVRFLPA